MKPTLGQVFAISLLGLTTLLGMLFYTVYDGSRRTLLESSERLRDNASREIGDRVASFSAEAPEAVEQFQRELARGLVDARDPRALESALFTLLFSNRNLGELTLTAGERFGFDEEGTIELAESGREQWSAVRTPAADGEDDFWSRHIFQENGVFVVEQRQAARDQPFGAWPSRRLPEENIPDPTSHPTFTTPARADFNGRLLWSDLHWSQLDAALPESQRRVEVSVQQVVTDPAGKFIGVLRAGLLTRQLDRAVALKIAPDTTNDPHRIFICDPNGRLITRIAASDRLVVSEDDLRIAPESLPPDVTSALRDPKLRAVSEETPTNSGHFQYAGREYLTTFRALPKTQDWIVGIVVPRDYYLGPLTAIRRRLLITSLGIMVFLVAGGGLILRGVKRGQARIVQESLKMNAFEFSPASTASAFRDVSAVLSSLEKAKTAMRAMGKYVPIDLVRRLYRERSEPALGGDLLEISIMFTDVRNFTTLSEKLAPDELARGLGHYLEVMAHIIQRETAGTIDKFIGDAIMTFWNAPEPVMEDARMACLAALRCRAAGGALARAAEWRGLPPFETRFGLHRGTALVGHFGAPDRMNYTAMGDSVNLASRLESLNKQYGTTIIASDKIEAEARDHFDFRLLDLVAVKGKSEAIKIYELLGEKGEAVARDGMIEAYEEAFQFYVARDFAAAIPILQRHEADAPSAVLLERCRAFQAAPPPADWEGVYVATSK